MVAWLARGAFGFAFSSSPAHASTWHRLCSAAAASPGATSAHSTHPGWSWGCWPAGCSPCTSAGTPSANPSPGPPHPQFSGCFPSVHSRWRLSSAWRWCGWRCAPGLCRNRLLHPFSASCGSAARAPFWWSFHQPSAVGLDKRRTQEVSLIVRMRCVSGLCWGGDKACLAHGVSHPCGAAGTDTSSSFKAWVLLLNCNIWITDTQHAVAKDTCCTADRTDSNTHHTTEQWVRLHSPRKGSYLLLQILFIFLTALFEIPVTHPKYQSACIYLQSWGPITMDMNTAADFYSEMLCFWSSSTKFYKRKLILAFTHWDVITSKQ